MKRRGGGNRNDGNNLRIIWISDDTHWTTGFGVESHNILTRIKQARPDWEVGALHWNYHGQPFPDGYGVLMLPDSGAGHFETAKRLVNGFQPDYLITLYDVFVSGAFMPQLSRKINPNSKTKWLSYFVWDTVREQACRSYQGIFDHCDLPVAMSKYGRDTVLEAYGYEVPFIYHGVDPAQWPQLPKEQIQDRRELYGNPDFIMGAFFRNIQRKQVVRLLEAWSRVSREYRDVQLILNMRPQDREGFDIIHYMHHFNLLGNTDEKGKLIESGPVRLGDQQSELFGVPVQELNLLYQVCDAQVLPTQGEGFGKPIIEGYQASGLPVIMSDNSTCPELVGDHGLSVECLDDYVWTPMAGALKSPSVKDLEDKMRIMIDDRKMRTKFQQANREFVKQFSFEKIMPQWLELIEKNVG